MSGHPSVGYIVQNSTGMTRTRIKQASIMLEAARRQDDPAFYGEG
jgi:hypothetical protein